MNEVRQFKWCGQASARGRLYNLGAYPGAVLDRAADTRIIGQVCQLPDNPAVLAALDDYEGFYYLNDHSDSLFVRTTTVVQFSDGREITCWIYVYNRDVGGALLVPDGDYAKIAALAKKESL